YVSWSNTGIKTITVYVNNNGCISDIASKDINVLLNYPKPELEFDRYVCLEDWIELEPTANISGPKEYIWNINDTTMTLGDGVLRMQANKAGWNVFTV